MRLDKVSLVDAGANKREFAILKRADAMPALNRVSTIPSEDAPGLLDRITKAIAGALGIEADVTKAQTFGTIIAGQQLQDALYDAWSTLQDSLWQAIWATDADGVDVPLKTKTALVASNLDEFKAWLLSQMDTGIAKREVTPEAVANANLDAIVRKVGKKISADRMARLKSAAEALASVLAEVESEVDTEKRAAAQEDDMTSDELTAALQPFADRLGAIEKKLDAAPVKKTDEEPDPKDEPKDDEEAPAWAVALVDRVEGIEKMLGRGQRTSAAGEDAVAKKSDDNWTAGIL
jgi:hypothetical protein